MPTLKLIGRTLMGLVIVVLLAILCAYLLTLLIKAP